MRKVDEMIADLNQLVNDEVYHLEPHDIERFIEEMDTLTDELWLWHRREASL